MLPLELPPIELYDDENNRFIYVGSLSLTLEHSLLSISKWESEYKKPWLETELSKEQRINYIRSMIVKYDGDLNRLNYITTSEINEVTNYINDTKTATWFGEDKKNNSTKRIVTSEVIYSWMAELNLPFSDCEKWHFNRLMTLIRVCSEERKPKEKMSEKDLMTHHASINAKRRAQAQKAKMKKR